MAPISKPVVILGGCSAAAAIVVFLFVAGALVSDSTDRPTVPVKSHHSNGVLLVDGALNSGGAATGLWTYRHENGRLACQGSCVKGDMAGCWIHWYDNGSLRAAGCFLDGVFHGDWVFYSRDGSKAAEATFASGEVVGPWQRFAKNGSSTPESPPMFPEDLGFLEGFKRIQQVKRESLLRDIAERVQDRLGLHDHQ